MFCPKCGKENTDGCRFCTACGEALEVKDVSPAPAIKENLPPIYMPDITEMPEQPKKQKGGKMVLITVLSALITIAVCLAAVFFLYMKAKQNASLPAEEEVTAADTEDDAVKDEKPDEEETELEETETAEAEEEIYGDGQAEAPAEEELEVMQRFVCVPVDKMALRETPGLGDDVITYLYAGTYLEWLGETETDGDRTFYKVKLIGSDDEGYVSSDYCVKVLNDYDESDLGIVDTSVQIYSYDMMVEDIYELASKYRGIISYEVIGQSVAGKDIYAVTLGNEYADNHVMVQAGIHGREYINSQVVMRMLEYYACYYDSAYIGKRTYRELFENTAFHVIPMSNPDGITISQYGVDALYDSGLSDIVYNAYNADMYYLIEKTDSDGNLYWEDHYKDLTFSRPGNARAISFDEYQTMWKANGRGVDLNNNFDAGWYDIDLKQYPCYSNYKGDYPESEPETQALVSYAKRYDYLCYLSYHSKGQLIYYDCKGNTTQMSEREKDFSDKISSVIKYSTVNTTDSTLVNLGGFGDWIQLSLNRLSVTIENGKAPAPVPVDEFDVIWLRHRELWSNIADI